VSHTQHIHLVRDTGLLQRSRGIELVCHKVDSSFWGNRLGTT